MRISEECPFPRINGLQRMGKNIFGLCSGGGQVVSVVAYSSDDPSLNPTDVYSVYSVNCLKRTEMNKNGRG